MSFIITPVPCKVEKCIVFVEKYLIGPGNKKRTVTGTVNRYKPIQCREPEPITELKLKLVLDP